MRTKPTDAELGVLAEIWREQEAPRAPLVDYSDPVLAVPTMWAYDPTDPQQLANAFLSHFGWPEWVMVYAKAPQAVLAASQLARSRGGAPGVSWVAPGCGAPFSPPRGEPGVAVLRCDWTPSEAEAQDAAEQAREQGLLLVLDETATGLRLAKGGASVAYRILPDLVLWAPPLPGGLSLGLLAGKGEPPQPPKQEPNPAALEAAATLLAWTKEDEVPARLAALGDNLAVGINYFAARAGLEDEIRLEGPPQMPRMEGRRMWAFINLAAQERLVLSSLLMLDPSLDEGDAQELVWPRLARACARLKVLPEGEAAPLGWKDAGPNTCHSVSHILSALDE